MSHVKAFFRLLLIGAFFLVIAYGFILWAVDLESKGALLASLMVLAAMVALALGLEKLIRRFKNRK